MSSAPSPDTVLEAVDMVAPPGTPLTTAEVADEFDCTARTIYNKLALLVDEGALETKKVGARGRVWWRRPEQSAVGSIEAAYSGSVSAPDRLQDGVSPSQTSIELPEHDRLYNVIFNQTFQFTGLMEPDGTLLEANETLLEFGGLGREDVIGEYFWDASWWQVDKATVKRLQDAIERAAAGDFIRYEVDVQGVDEIRTIDFSIRPIENEYGDVELLIPEGRDITERKEHERRLEHFKRIVEMIQDGVYVTDGEGRFTFVNDAFVAMGEHDREELLGSHGSTFFGDRFVDTHEEEWQELVAGERNVVEFETNVAGSDGGTRTVRNRFVALPMSEETGRVGVTRDVTERTRTLQQLQHVDRLNAVIRTIVQTVVRAETRHEIAQTVCETLCEFDAYQATMMGEFSSSFDDYEPWAMTGDIETFLDGVLAEESPPLSAGIGASAARTGDFHVRQDLSEVPYDYWQQLATTHGIQSYAAIPLMFQETAYGVLGVFADRPDAFDQEKQRILMELGEIIGYALYALERKEVLNPTIEVEFQSAQNAQLFRTETDADFDYALDSVVPLADGTQREFWTVTGVSPQIIRTILANSVPSALEFKLLRKAGETARFQVTSTEESIVTIFDTFDGRFTSGTVKDDTGTILGRFPDTVDTEAVTQVMREQFPDIELVAQRRVLTPTCLRQLAEDQLTERQQTVLRLAYFGGYYEQPRLSTGDELAAELGISRQTFHHHLRKAEDTVFYHLFEQAAALSL